MNATLTSIGARVEHVAFDQTTLNCRVWSAEGHSAGRVVLVHGLESHAGWFQDFAERLVTFGWTAIAFDREGSGSSGGRRGDARSPATLFDQLRTILNAIEPARPTHLIAHSWGARWALAQALVQPDDFRSIVLLAPGFALRRGYWPPMLATGLLKRLMSASATLPTPIDDDRDFTTRPTWLKFLAEDRNRLPRVTVQTLLTSRKLERLVRRGGASLRCPVLHLVAGRDAICDGDRNRELLRAMIPADLYHEIVYPDGEHSLLFECDRLPIVDDVNRWLSSHR
jgi:alpha-beta hydrolase superfamily lysophospholipase